MTKKLEIEVRGADVEKAIEAGLQKLGVSRSEVIIDVIDEGSRGLLGIGSRDAVVRLVSLSSPEPAATARPCAQRTIAEIREPSETRRDARSLIRFFSAFNSPAFPSASIRFSIVANRSSMQSATARASLKGGFERSHI